MQEVLADVAYATTNLDGESVQAALNARLRRTARLTFFDDESGGDEMHIEPADYNLVTGLVDRRGLPEFAKARGMMEPGWAWSSREGHWAWATT